MDENCLRDCPVAARVENLENQAEEFQAQNSSSHKEIFARLNSLEKAEAVQEVHYTNIIAKLDNLTTKVTEIEQKPGKRWEALVADVVKLVVAAVVGFFLGKAGLG